MLRVSNPENTNWWCCSKVVSKVRAKWVETNPLLVLIQDESILLKISRSYETALLINQNKAKVKAKKLFMDRVDHLFDILVHGADVHHKPEEQGWAEGGRDADRWS